MARSLNAARCRLSGVSFVEHQHRFVCRRCGHAVDQGPAGTRHRNHCPNCLWSVHVDRSPGDRAEACGGSMEPIAVWVRSRGEWALVHRCQQCGSLKSNRIAGDDSSLSLMSLAVKALASPPFPLEYLDRLDRPQ
jgi:DNA-directed RNA polymerase subunit RPC12/RpoP